MGVGLQRLLSEALQDHFQEHFNNMKETVLHAAMRASIKGVWLESPEDAKAAVNEFCAQSNAGHGDQAYLKIVLLLRQSVHRLKVVSECVSALTGTTKLQFRRDARLSCKGEHVSVREAGARRCLSAHPRRHALPTPRGVRSSRINASASRCTNAPPRCLWSTHMRFIPGGQCHRRTETRHSRQVIGELGGIEAARVSDGLTLLRQRLYISYRRLADALVGEGTTVRPTSPISFQSFLPRCTPACRSCRF